MRRALFAALLLLAVGCNEGPTDPDRTETLSGTLARTASATSLVTMGNTGNLRVTAVNLEQVAADSTATAANGGIVFGIGTGDTTTCSLTGSFSLIETSLISLGLQKGAYCVKLTEPTAVPEGSSLRYEVRLEITD
jgi:hypothetical protein